MVLAPIAPPFPLAVSFGVLCSLLFLRSRKAIVPIICSMPVFLLAHVIAHAAYHALGSDGAALAMSFGGFVGALLMTGLFGVFRRQFLTWRCLAGAALIGALAAIPFGAWLRLTVAESRKGFSQDDPEKWLWLLKTSYAFWQAALGTYLYSISVLVPERARLPEAPPPLPAES